MLEKIIIVCLDMGLLILYSLAGLAIAIIIQLISYRVLHFNLYKFIKNKLAELDKQF